MRFFSAMMLSVMAAGCGGFCGGEYGNAEASLYVSDENGDPVEGARFFESGADVNTSCGETDGNQRCVYNILFLSAATHYVLVSAPGFQSQGVRIDTTSNDSVHLAVALARLTKLQKIEAIIR